MGSGNAAEKLAATAPAKAVEPARSEPERRPGLAAYGDAVGSIVRTIATSRSQEASKPSAVPPEVHRAGVLAQITSIQRTMSEHIRDGLDQAKRSIERAEYPSRPSLLGQLVRLAASLALAEAGAALIPIILDGVVSEGAAKLFASAFRSSVKGAFKADPPAGDAMIEDLRAAYEESLAASLADARHRFESEFSTRYDHLAELDTEALERVASTALEALATSREPMVRAAKQSALVGWVNLVAQANVGAMRGWDSWDESNNGQRGAIRLPGALSPSADLRGADIVKGNVDPFAIDLDTLHDPNASLHAILEIQVNVDGRLKERMKLTDVGPDVRRQLKHAGHVRDLKINKAIRIVDHGPDAWPITSLLITADGYVRRSDWSQLMTAVVPQGSYSASHDCFGALIENRNTADCHYTPEIDEKNIVELAEKVQNLSLKNLEI